MTLSAFTGGNTDHTVRPTVKIPVKVMENLFQTAMIGFQLEDGHNVVEMQAEEFGFFKRIIERGMQYRPDDDFTIWANEELQFFEQEFSHVSDPDSKEYWFRRTAGCLPISYIP
jgi:hypothetical protein